MANTGLAADTKNWSKLSTLGAESDVVTNKGAAYQDFYNLATGRASGYALAGYSEDNGTPSGSSSAINIIGASGAGVATALGSAAHVTLEVGTGDKVGTIPINVQSNENTSVVGVAIDLTKSTVPAQVAIGTDSSNTVSAMHKVSLGDSGGTVYLGANASGGNKVIAGSGSVMMNNEGSGVGVSLYGGSGDDSIKASSGDVVKGGSGADIFYDTATYKIQDYSAVEGDAIIATALDSLKNVAYGNVHQNSNSVSFGDSENYVTVDEDANGALHVKVAVMDNNGKVKRNKRDVFLDNGAGIVDASSATSGALIITNAYSDGTICYNSVIGSAGNDSIYVGAGDTVNGGAGNDSINIDSTSGRGAVVAIGTGDNTVKGWSFGFDKTKGNTQLNADGQNVTFTVKDNNGRLKASVAGGTMAFEDTKDDSTSHGQYDVLVDDKKYTLIRSGYTAIVNENKNVADYYIADKNGNLLFTKNVTKNLGTIDLGSDEYKNITNLVVNNNSTASVIGTAYRETVIAGGDASVSSHKSVSLGGGNDYIVSGGDSGAGHTFFFGAGDGVDTVTNFGHYSGVSKDPQKKYADTLVLESYTDLNVREDSSGNARIEIKTTASDRVVVQESGGLNVNSDMYLLKIGNDSTKVAKIGYTAAAHEANTFTYDKEVSYYIGAAAKATDKLVVGSTVANVDIQLNGSDGKYYRGISEIDATAVTNTRLTLVGGAANDTIYAGGVSSHNSLWGGAGDNVLYGGEGVDNFFFELQGNKDEIYNYTFGKDVINVGGTLADVNLSRTSISDDAVKLEFNNGSKLTVYGNQNVTFHMSDGASYTANKNNHSWE